MFQEFHQGGAEPVQEEKQEPNNTGYMEIDPANDPNEEEDTVREGDDEEGKTDNGGYMQVEPSTGPKKDGEEEEGNLDKEEEGEVKPDVDTGKEGGTGNILGKAFERVGKFLNTSTPASTPTQTPVSVKVNVNINKDYELEIPENSTIKELKEKLMKDIIFDLIVKENENENELDDNENIIKGKEYVISANEGFTIGEDTIMAGGANTTTATDTDESVANALNDIIRNVYDSSKNLNSVNIKVLLCQMLNDNPIDNLELPEECSKYDNLSPRFISENPEKGSISQNPKSEYLDIANTEKGSTSQTKGDSAKNSRKQSAGGSKKTKKRGGSSKKRKTLKKFD